MSSEKCGVTCPQVVYVVMCYQNVVGVYASQDDAFQVQRDLIQKNRPADVLCRSVIYTDVLKNG